MILYDADRCPYCARVRIVLAEKDIEYENVQIDLSDRPAWLYEKNPLGRVPVLEDDTLVLPESAVIMEYLEERFPEPALLPEDPAARALVRLAVEQFDTRLGDDYYAFRRGGEGAEAALEARLEALNRMLEAQGHFGGAAYGLADIAYLPWIVRLRDLLGYPLGSREALVDWLAQLSERPAVAAELGVVGSLPRP